MPGKASRVNDVSETLMEAQAHLRDAIALMTQATTIAHERELHVKAAIDTLRHGGPTRDLATAYRELGIPLDGAETPSAAD